MVNNIFKKNVHIIFGLEGSKCR